MAGKRQKLKLIFMAKRFQKRKEDFVCANCGAFVIGNGYTDHCPNCLYSKHVDINPGDRRANCGGLMEPIGLEVKNGAYRIKYRCLKCGYRHWVKAAANDNRQALIKLSQASSGQKSD